MPRAPDRPQLSRALILRLQTTCGNRAVQRLVESQAAGAEAAVADPDLPAPPPRRSWLAKLFGKLFGNAT